jgi:hypothetical protein
MDLHDHRATVSVSPGTALTARSRLFSVLEAAFPVSFVSDNRIDAEAEIAFCDHYSFPAEGEVGGSDRPTLVIGDRSGSRARPGTVRFGESDSLDTSVRGIAVSDPVDGPSPVAATGSAGSTETLARVGGFPVWTRARGRFPTDRVSSSLPELGAAQTLRDFLFQRPLTAIALIQFLRGISRSDSYELPKHRAAFLFDDPNLRWKTYGFIDYRQLLDHADAHGYHAAMAMIPLDGWRQHRATVDLFRQRRDRLSLVMHGNNHLSEELMRTGSDPAALAITAEAMRRAARFEARYGLRMDRVMTPPHGLCAPSIARALSSLGYDALCAIHPLPWTERPPADRPLAGWHPAEFAAGCAVIPRLTIDADFSELALRAFLGQPLILYGHHDDLAGGLDLLAETAKRVNGLGDVEWTSLGEIAATNHATRLIDGTLRVQPYSHRLRLQVPQAAHSLAIEQPRGSEHRLAGWSVGDTDPVAFDTATDCRPGTVELRLHPAVAIDPAAVPSPSPSVWPIVRRTATEARDRLRPILTAGSN